MTCHYQEQVRKFHEATSQPCPDRPTMPDAETRALRVRLLLEEVLEYANASGFEVQVDGAALGGGCDFEVVNRLPAGVEPELSEMAHEATDVLYVAVGSLVAMGAPVRECFDEVSGANLRKAQGGTVQRRPDGKVLKPEGWRPPDVGAVLAKVAEQADKAQKDTAAPQNPLGLRDPSLAFGGDSR